MSNYRKQEIEILNECILEAERFVKKAQAAIVDLKDKPWEPSSPYAQAKRAAIDTSLTLHQLNRK